VKLLRRLTDRQPPDILRLPPDLRVVPTPPPAAEFQKTQGRDQLTGLPNRPCFTHYLTVQATLAAQLETRLSLLVIDWAGHTAPGVRVDARNRRLSEVADLLRATLRRPHDMLGCLGRGRFAALLPFTDATGAEYVAKNLKSALCVPGQLDAEPPPVNEAAWSEAIMFGKRPVSARSLYEEPVAARNPHSATTLNIGMASYCGKGPLQPETMLFAAERAADLAALDGATHTVRFDLTAAAS
jgi:GGDEF domain-containing protein